MNATASHRRAQLRVVCDRAEIRPSALALDIPVGTREELQLSLGPLKAGLCMIKVMEADGTSVAEAQTEIIATTISPSAFKSILSAKLMLDIFGSDHGAYEDKSVFLNGVRLDVLPKHRDAWGRAAMRLPREAVVALKAENDIRIENGPGDAFKVRGFQLRLCLRDGTCLVSERNDLVFTNWEGWAHGEGTCFDSGKPLTGLRVTIPVDAASSVVCEAGFGRIVSAELVMNLFDVNGGGHADKPVLFNGIDIGALPTAPGRWTTRTMPLSQEAIDTLTFANVLVLNNSRPPDAFKVRGIHLRVKTEAGDVIQGKIDPQAYTSVPWKYAEGKIGMPVDIKLRLPRQLPSEE
jgi:hypothetical protein